MDILTLVQNALHERYDIPLAEIQPETTLETLGVDSLGLVELVFELEDRLGIRVPQDFAAPATVADLVSIVDGVLKTQEKQAA
jgi:acyl carrier protein